MPYQRPILWVHEEALGPANPALRAWPNAPALFVFDTRWIQQQQISRKRLGFLRKRPRTSVTLRKGDVAAEVLLLRRHQADGVVSSRAVDPRLDDIAPIEAELPLDMLIQTLLCRCTSTPAWTLQPLLA